MSKVSMKIECLCGMSNEIVFKKPSHFVPTIHKEECEDCESTILYKFIHKGNKMVSYERAVVKMGDTLKLIMIEQEQDKKEQSMA